MAAGVQETSVDLSKVDSAISDVPASPSDKKEPKHRRTSSTVSGVFNINDLGELIPLMPMIIVMRDDDGADELSREGGRRAQDRAGDAEAELVSGRFRFSLLLLLFKAKSSIPSPADSSEHASW